MFPHIISEARPYDVDGMAPHSDSVKIKIGQVFRVMHPSRTASAGVEGIGDYARLTKGRHGVSADVNKGIWGYREVDEPGQSFRRRPAVLLHSNPFKEGTEASPWVDVIRPDAGYAIYNGDNRRSTQNPFQTRGNALLQQLTSFYSDPERRRFAPPVLLFVQCDIDGNRKGFREFCGYGIPVQQMFRTQREQKSGRYFVNVAVELTLFSLEHENEEFDWAWIDARRDGSANADSVLKLAPAAWKLWVREGGAALERCRRHIIRRRIMSVSDQLPLGRESQLLTRVIAYFSKDRHSFEGLASLIAQRVLGMRCRRGWVTKRSGDGGVDFVCRLDLGDLDSDFSRAPVVVLGQAKCQGIKRSIGGKDLARVVARLQRGWLGVFVTTGVFSEAAQKELDEDKYPLILINGQRFARELRLLLSEEGISLEDLLRREVTWYDKNLQPFEASRILDETLLGTSVEAPGRSERIRGKRDLNRCLD